MVKVAYPRLRHLDGRGVPYMRSSPILLRYHSRDSLLASLARGGRRQRIGLQRINGRHVSEGGTARLSFRREDKELGPLTFSLIPLPGRGSREFLR